MDKPPESSVVSARLADLRSRLPVRAVATGAGVLGVGLLLFLFLRPQAGPAPEITLPRAGAGGADAAAAPAGVPSGSTAAPGALVTVHMAGAVAHPGVYTLPLGARVADVLVAAGGPLPEANLDQLNLAAKVADSDRVYVARQGEQPSAGAPGGATTTRPGGAPSGPLDLNTATVEQLDTLPGVGPATAQAIVSYRTRHGRFRSVTELLDVPGIGPTRLDALRPLVKV